MYVHPNLKAHMFTESGGTSLNYIIAGEATCQVRSMIVYLREEALI